MLVGGDDGVAEDGEGGDLARGEEALAMLEKELERLEPELDALAKGGILR